jgi:peptidyl-prolyl cis-trans isomerase D
MAVIQKIRNKYAKLAGFIIALSLVGFILMDAASGRFGELFGRDASVVKVNGEKVDAQEYSQRVKEYEALYNYSSQGRSLDEATRAQINDQALNELINEKLIAAECEKLGIQTTKEEEKDAIYGPAPDQIVQQYRYFVNPDTRMFDPQRVKAFEQQVEQMDPTGKTKEEWEALKAYVLRNRLVRKYNAMLTSFIYTPKYLMDRQVKEQNELASIRYVKVPFATINDADIKVTGADRLHEKTCISVHN